MQEDSHTTGKREGHQDQTVVGWAKHQKAQEGKGWGNKVSEWLYLDGTRILERSVKISNKFCTKMNLFKINRF